MRRRKLENKEGEVKRRWRRSRRERGGGRQQQRHQRPDPDKGRIHHVAAGIPEYVRSGFDRPEKRTGRQPPPKKEAKFDPKDGGVWEPVRREYPKVVKVEHEQGTKVVDRPRRETRPVDIWPDTITVRDQFQPGGVRIFAGKRTTNTTAFPGAIGYTPPDPKIDYSSVQHGGPFGFKLLHRNEVGRGEISCLSSVLFLVSGLFARTMSASYLSDSGCHPSLN